MQLVSTARLVLRHWLVESLKYKNDVLSASRCSFFFFGGGGAIHSGGGQVRDGFFLGQQYVQKKTCLPHANLLHHIGHNRPTEFTG